MGTLSNAKNLNLKHHAKFSLVLLKHKHLACQFVILLTPTKRLERATTQKLQRKASFQHLGRKKKAEINSSLIKRKSEVRVSFHTLLNFCEALKFQSRHCQ